MGVVFACHCSGTSGFHCCDCIVALRIVVDRLTVSQERASLSEDNNFWCYYTGALTKYVHGINLFVALMIEAELATISIVCSDWSTVCTISAL